MASIRVGGTRTGKERLSRRAAGQVEGIGRGMGGSRAQRQGPGLVPPRCPGSNSAWDSAGEQDRPAELEQQQGQKPGQKQEGLRTKKKGHAERLQFAGKGARFK